MSKATKELTTEQDIMVDKKIQENNICLRLKQNRLDKKITIKTIAEAVNVSEKTITRWENSTPIPSDKLALLSDIGLDIIYILTGRTNKYSRIREERIRLGFTQQQVADLCEVSRVQWGRYERGDTELKGRVLKSFLGLGANIYYISFGANDNSMYDLKLISKNEKELLELFKAFDFKQMQALTHFLKSFSNS